MPNGPTEKLPAGGYRPILSHAPTWLLRAGRKSDQRGHVAGQKGRTSLFFQDWRFGHARFDWPVLTDAGFPIIKVREWRKFLVEPLEWPPAVPMRAGGSCEIRAMGKEATIEMGLSS